MPGKIKTVLCYGDSNTYGYCPADGNRYAKEERWTGILQKKLGKGYQVAEEGCNGRTTVFEDPAEPWKTGKFYLKPCLNTHKPIDTVILMLGSNDLKKNYQAGAAQIADGAGALVDEIRSFLKKKQGFAPQIILVSPPEVSKAILDSPFRDAFDETAVARSKAFPKEYQRVAKEKDCMFFNAALYAPPSGIDGLHLSVDGHRKLADGLYQLLMQAEEKTPARKNCQESPE